MTKPITIDLPDRLRRSIERIIRGRGQSVEDFVVEAVAGRALEEEEAIAFFAERARRAKPGTAERFLREQAGDEPPRPGDEID